MDMGSNAFGKPGATDAAMMAATMDECEVQGRAACICGMHMGVEGNGVLDGATHTSLSDCAMVPPTRTSTW
jgi:hypothetical protein